MPRQAHRDGKVTIRSVAERAGVSVMTVSNVINRRGKAGPETVAAVNRAIEVLGYKPNHAARQLVGTRGTAIGLIYANRETPFLDAILINALKATTARGLQLMVCDGAGHSPEEAIDLARQLVAGGADALLVIPPFAELLSGTRDFHDLGVPTAAVATGSALPDMSTLRIDNRAAMHDMADFVLAQSHRKIGFVAGPSGHGDSHERLAGFKDALHARGLAFDADLSIEGAFTFTSGVEAASRLLDRAERPTAIIACNDDMAAGVVAEAHRRDIAMPDRLIVTGFDDTRIATRIWPPLTVIRQPIGAMALRATELLIASLNGQGPTSAPVDEIFAHSFIDRSIPHSAT